MLKVVKSIRSRLGAMHFLRFSVLETKVFRIYLHRILRPDEDRHLHTHPWNFISIILRGSYVERTKDRGLVTRLPLSVVHRPADLPHKVEKVNRPCWTLVVAWGRKRPWGFDVDGTIVPNEQYRALKHMKAL